MSENYNSEVSQAAAAVDDNASSAAVGATPEAENPAPRKRKRDSTYFKWAMTIFFLVLAVLLVYFGFFKSNSFFNFLSLVWKNLMPFAIGGVIAFLLRPLCRLFEKLLNKAFVKMKNRDAAGKWVHNLSIACSVIVFLLVIASLIYLVIPQFSSSIQTLIREFNPAFEKSMAWVKNLDIVKNNAEISAQVEEISVNLGNTITKLLVNTFGSDGNKIMTTLTSGIKSVYEVAKNIFFGLVSSVYILHQRHKFRRQSKMIINSIFSDKWSKIIIDEAHYCDKMFNGFINGKIIDSMIIGVLCFIVCTIFRIPYAILVSVFVGITNIIPFFGPFIGAIPTAFIILMVDPIKCLYFVIIIIVLQQFDGNVLGPKILGEATGVQSFWVLFSVLFFGGLWGFTGMLIGVPLFAVIYDIITRLVKKGLEARKKTEILAAYQAEKLEEDRIAAQKEDKKRNRIKRALEKRAAKNAQKEKKDQK